MDRQILNPKPLIQVGYCLRNSIDDMSNFVCNNEFYILDTKRYTLAAS